MNGAFDGPALTPLTTMHGVVFSLWVLFFIVQPLLVRGGRFDAHRLLGLMGAVLAGVMVVIGVATALAAAARGHAPGGGDPRAFLIYPLGGITVFAATIAAAISLRGSPGAHKRLMLIANISLLDPAIARLPLAFLAVHPLTSFGLACLVAVMLAIFDVTVRVHRVTLVGGALTAAWQPIAFVVNETAWWLDFAGWLIGRTCGTLAGACPIG